MPAANFAASCRLSVKTTSFCECWYRYLTHESIGEDLVDFLDSCGMRTNRGKASSSPIGIATSAFPRKSIVGPRMAGRIIYMIEPAVMLPLRGLQASCARFQDRFSPAFSHTDLLPLFVYFTLHPCLINGVSFALRPKYGISIVLFLIDTHWASRDGFQGRLVMHHIICLICPFASITTVVDLATGTTNDDIQHPSHHRCIPVGESSRACRASSAPCRDDPCHLRPGIVGRRRPRGRAHYERIDVPVMGVGLVLQRGLRRGPVPEHTTARPRLREQTHRQKGV